MAGDEKVKNSVSGNVCKCCKSNVASSIARCIQCDGVYHTSCALRVAGLIAVGRNNLVRCCPQQSEVMSQANDLENQDVTAILQAKEETLRSKDEIIKELRAKELLLYKNIDLLEDKLKDLEGKFSTPGNREKTHDENKNNKESNLPTEQICSANLQNKGKQQAEIKKNNTKLDNKITLPQVNEAVNKALIQEENQSKLEPSESEWKTQNKKKARKQIIATGASKDSKFSGAIRRQWIYVGGISGTEVSEQTIKEFLEEVPDSQNIEVKKLPTKGKNSAFSVGIPRDTVPTVFDKDFWPKGIILRQFNLKNLFLETKQKNERAAP